MTISAYLGFFEPAAIVEDTNSYQLHADIKPIDSSGTLVAPTENNVLKGSDKFKITGPETGEPYSRWFAIESYLFNVRSSDVAGGSELIVYLQPSDVTPAMVEACATNFEFAFARLDVYIGATTEKKRLVVTMPQATIIDFRSFTGSVTDGQQGGVDPTGNVEQYTIKFKRCEWGVVTGAGNVVGTRRWETG